MVTVNPLIDLSAFPISRQTLFEMWSTGTLTAIGVEDFAEGFLPILVGTNFSDAPQTPQPGQLFFHRMEHVMYLYTDVLDGTGVSLWLAVGPDKFETAVLADQSIPAGFPLEPVYDRRVRIATAGKQYPLGFNQSGIPDPSRMNTSPYGGETSPTNSWLRAGVDGLVYGVVNNALSNPTNTAPTWTTSRYLSLDLTVQGSLMAALSQGTPNFNIVGLSTTPAAAKDGGTVSEPSFFVKFQFQPRVLRGFTN